MKLTLIASSLLAFSIQSHATIAITLQADLLKDQLGNPAPMGSMALLIASTADALFASLPAGLNTSAGTQVGASDDYIVGAVSGLSWADVGAFEATFQGGTALTLGAIPGWTAGDSLALVWVPSLVANATVIPGNTFYGLYTRNVATLSDGSAAWLTPTDGNDATLTFVTQDGNIFSPGSTASNAPNVSRATLQAVPEPTSAFLIAVGAAGLMMRRRRQS